MLRLKICMHRVDITMVEKQRCSVLLGKSCGVRFQTQTWLDFRRDSPFNSTLHPHPSLLPPIVNIVAPHRPFMLSDSDTDISTIQKHYTIVFFWLMPVAGWNAGAYDSFVIFTGCVVIKLFLQWQRNSRHFTFDQPGSKLNTIIVEG